MKSKRLAVRSAFDSTGFDSNRVESPKNYPEASFATKHYCILNLIGRMLFHVVSCCFMLFLVSYFLLLF